MSIQPFAGSSRFVSEENLETDSESFTIPLSQDNLCLVEKEAGVWIIPRDVLVTYCRFVPCGPEGIAQNSSRDNVLLPSTNHDFPRQAQAENVTKSPAPSTSNPPELLPHNPGSATLKIGKRKSDNRFEASRKKSKIPETDDEIAAHGVEKIVSGLPRALDTLDIGTSRTVESFLQEYQGGTGDNEHDAFWQESMKVTKDALVYRWVLRYMSSCKGICLGEASDAVDEREDKFRFRWRALTSGVNRLVDLLWDKYGLLALVPLMAMAGKNFLFTYFTALGPKRRETVISKMADELSSNRILLDYKATGQALKNNICVLNPAMTLSKTLSMSYEETCRLLNLGRLASIAMPPTWAVYFRMQDLANISNLVIRCSTTGRHQVRERGQESVGQEQPGDEYAVVSRPGQQPSTSTLLQSTAVVRFSDDLAETDNVPLERDQNKTAHAIQDGQACHVVDLSNIDWDSLSLEDVDHMSIDEISQHHDNLLSFGLDYEAGTDGILQTVLDTDTQGLGF